MRAQQTVAAYAVGGHPGDVFSVSRTTGDGIDGAILNVRRCRWLPAEQAARFQARGTGLSMVVPRELDGRVQVIFPMPDDGRPFASREEAEQFCLERGYTAEYFTSPDLRARRIETAKALPYPRSR